MHAPATLYRLRDRLALTRPELTALLTVTTLFAAGLVARHLPAPPAQLSPEVIRYEQLFASASAETGGAIDTARVETSAPGSAKAGTRTAKALPARPVGLNSATAAQLERLPRVGPKMAERILDYRNSRGQFTRIEELRNVRGIGEKTFEQLRPLVTLD